MKKARIAVLVSGGGTNLQALLDAQKAGNIPHGEIVLVVSNVAGAYALRRAAQAGVPARTVRKTGSQQAFDEELLATLTEFQGIWWCWQDFWPFCPKISPAATRSVS